MPQEASNDPFGGVLGDLHPYRARFGVHAELPKHGLSREEVLRQLEAIAAEERARWEKGQVSGTYYHGGADHYAFLNQVFALYSHANLLQRDLCPSGTKFEGEILAMTRRMLNGGEDVVGAVTTGGTDSILHAMLVYRELGRSRGIARPQLIGPESIHPAFQKAAHYFGLELTRVPVAPDYRADVKAITAAIGPATVALIGSAGNYPWGLIDPLTELSALALERKLGFHVDGCLGGFLLPWLERLGEPIPLFDFRLPGVTSMTCDTHKYGFGLKGTSTVLYRGKELRRLQYFRTSEWQGGVYVSPTMHGSRSEGLAASTWAAMVTLGEEGYLEAAARIAKAAKTIRAGILALPELELIGDPTFLLAFRGNPFFFLGDARDLVSKGPDLDVFHVNDYLATKGWRLNGCQHPPALHFCVTLPQAQPGAAERFAADLRDAVAYAKEPHDGPPKSAAMYGLAGTPSGREMLDELLFLFLDETYEP